jgi:predicted extracellular nuclease
MGERERAKRLAARIVEAMRSPDIIAVQEIQDNDGPTVSSIVKGDRTYEMLIELIKQAGGPAYAWCDLPPQNGEDGGERGGNIRCGYLYRPDRVSVVPGSLERIAEDSPVFESTRKPLVARFSFKGHELEVVNNHFTSRRGSTPWNGTLQPPLVGGHDKRVAQAQVVNNHIERARTARPAADRLVLGDANDMPGSQTQRTVASGNFVDLSELVPPKEAYDYNYRGTLQSLNMAVGNKELVEQGRVEIEHLHGNALAPLDDSDHDHLVLRITVPKQPAQA